LDLACLVKDNAHQFPSLITEVVQFLFMAWRV
jgi:hypothetical protein